MRESSPERSLREFGLYGVLLLLTLILFGIDLLVPLGTSVWVAYLVPVALSFLSWRPYIPVLLAAMSSILTVVGFFYGPPGIDPDVAQVNRMLGAATAWTIAITGVFFVRNKLAVNFQEWLQLGQVGLSKAIAGEQRLDELAENILQFLCAYLNSPVGSIFFLEEDGYRRYGTQGVPSDSPIPERFGLDDGLLGQVAKKSEALAIEEVPDGYLYLGSSLGRSKPRHLLIVPAAGDGQVSSVVELGFLGGRMAHAQRFLERASESIATAVRSAKYRVRLHELLEETQRQAEELQQQSEELRVSNEELEEQSRALQESQARLELQQSELEQTNAQLEEQTQALEQQRDDLAQTRDAMTIQAKELAQASRYKSEFVANMSHELRTPLNSLLILAKLLSGNRDGNLSDEQIKFAQTIESSGNDLLTLINDILDISKIEAGRIELQLDRVRIETVVDRLAEAFHAGAEQKGLAFRTEIAPDAPAFIATDGQRVEQVLRNFIANAIKFTDRGEVVLRVAPAMRGRVTFSVRDTGIGIAEDQQETIFEAFRQADGTINRQYGGTGLGLSISRELSRLLGGVISVSSKPDAGSTFTLTLPVEFAGAGEHEAKPFPMPVPPSVSAPEPSRLNGSSFKDDREILTGENRIILVVEDDLNFVQILYDLAHELDFACLVAEFADEGVLLARQYLPVAIILDIGLPDHSGLSVLDRLKRDIRTRHIPVHVVSVEDYSQASRSIGAAGFMLKPVKRDALIQALEGLETTLVHRVRRVLIVEDNAEQLESIRQLLASRDVETVGAPTAAECRRLLQAEPYDCVVLDLSLPDASGFDLLEDLSRETAIVLPPVIVYTGRDLAPEDENRLRKYSKSIIIKGARSPERLLDEVTLFLHQVVSEMPERQQKLLAKSLNRDAALEGRRILVVEDDVRNVYSLTSIFEPHGAIIEIARNGQEAIEALERTSVERDNACDLILMDVMMPVMDGLTAMRAIRSRPQWKGLPIIALTAKAGPRDHQDCLAAGANDYIAKPIDVEKLLSLARVWLPR